MPTPDGIIKHIPIFEALKRDILVGRSTWIDFLKVAREIGTYLANHLLGAIIFSE